MRVLTYDGLDLGDRVRAFEKVRDALLRDDLRSADVKKLTGFSRYYRAKLDDADRLLLQFVEHRGETCCLVLERIAGHAYDRSRFLRGAPVDPQKIEEPRAEAEPLATAPIRYLHPERAELHFLDKPLSFDDAQDAIYRLPAPLLLVGSAGSGKTALVLERLRVAQGAVAYVTHSTFLTQTARALFFAHAEEKEDEPAEFLSFRELLESIRVPRGKPVTFRAFREFFGRHRQTCRFTDAHRCFEELRGVIGADPTGPLSRDAYLALGVRQSIFAPPEREIVHALFDKYRAWLEASALYDSNLVAHAYAAQVEPRFDHVVVDEVQDFTPAELTLVLRMLRRPGQFVLAGDANQIVHPNFFSWAKVKTLLFRDPALADRQRVEVLSSNFRNARAVTDVANALLKTKNARFGSIDRETTELVRPVGDEQGSVTLATDGGELVAELDRKTRRSTAFAVLVLRDEDKDEARVKFQTPLLFSVHEAKGLEYENVVLYRFVSSARAELAEVCAGVDADDLAVADLEYRRSRDKSDKSLEVYKFYVNALYVAVTRAVKNVYWIESDLEHPLLRLLDLRSSSDAASKIAGAESSVEEWQKEARRLELQGKDEQAEAIRRTILRVTPVPWPIIDGAAHVALAEKAMSPNAVSTKAKQTLFDSACVHGDGALVWRLRTEADFGPAARFEAQKAAPLRRELEAYGSKNIKGVLGETERYGVDFRSHHNLTPLMRAAAAGNVPLVQALVARGARRELTDHYGKTAMHWALGRAYRDERFARESLGPIWELVAPPTIDLRVDDRLVKIGRAQAEYFLLAAAVALFRGLVLSDYGWRSKGLQSTTFLGGAFSHFPDNVVAERRRRREYVNAVLARNEVESKYVPARRLFVREQQGHYVPNEAIAIRSVTNDGTEEWRPLAEALGMSFSPIHVFDPGAWRRRNEEQQRARESLRASSRDFAWVGSNDRALRRRR